jgi:dipeptidase E
MKQLFLTSSVNYVAKDIATRMETKGKKLVFIDTAAEIETGDKGWLDDDRKSLVRVGFLVTDYTISNKTKDELARDLAVYDAIYVSGGNTFYLLQQAQLSGFIDVIRDLVINKEKTYIGTSAGSIIAGPDTYPTFRLDNASLAPELNGYKGFKLVNFCILPHWGSEHFKALYLNKRLDHAYDVNQVPLLALTDSQYVHVSCNKMEIIDVNNLSV